MVFSRLHYQIRLSSCFLFCFISMYVFCCSRHVHCCLHFRLSFRILIRLFYLYVAPLFSTLATEQIFIARLFVSYCRSEPNHTFSAFDQFLQGCINLSSPPLVLLLVIDLHLPCIYNVLPSLHYENNSNVYGNSLPQVTAST